jgi:hypothetical protein
MKKYLKGYYTPTPKNIRRFADALLAASTIIATYAISTDYKAIGITALIMGVVGKFLSNFFNENNEKK